MALVGVTELSHPPYHPIHHTTTPNTDNHTHNELTIQLFEAGSAEEGSWISRRRKLVRVWRIFRCAEVHAVELRGRPDTRAEIVIAATFLLRNRSHIVRNVNERVWLLAQRGNLSLA